MTSREREFWLRFQRRAALLQPDVAAELFRAYRVLRDSLSEAQVARLITEGRIDQILDDALLDRAFLPLRERVVRAVERGFQQTIPDLPRGGRVASRGGPTTLAVGFDHLSPKVIDGIRVLDSRAINTLKTEARDVVRAHVENGLRNGTAPKAIGRELRQVVGLAPSQEAAVQNFRQMLREGDREALTRVLRDHRFDATLRRAFAADGAGLSADQVDTMATAYRKRFVAFNAETNARTLTLDSFKLGQKLAWDDALAKGIVDPARMVKDWIAVAGPMGDGRNRPEHLAMHGETVAYDAAFSNGEVVPGESTFNCRCVARYRQRAAAKPEPAAA